MILGQVARARLRRRWHRQLDRADREAVGSRLDVYPFLNTLMVELLDSEPALNPRYLYGVIHAVRLAQHLDVKEIALLEFGTGRADGTRGKQRAAELLEPQFGVTCQVHTFDIGTGIPDTGDVRDLPHHVVPGGYKDFDAEAIRKKIAPAQLHVGSFEDGVRAFLEEPAPPVGYFELDTGTYSGAVGGLALLREAPHDRLMPRLPCFVSGLCGFTFGDHNGARYALRQHNDAHPRRPVSQLHGLRYGFVPRRFRDQEWVEEYFVAHIFDHPRYAEPDGLFRVLPTASIEFDGKWEEFAPSFDGAEPVAEGATF